MKRNSSIGGRGRTSLAPIGGMSGLADTFNNMSVKELRPKSGRFVSFILFFLIVSHAFKPLFARIKNSRSSVYTATSRLSMIGASTGPMKDPRPIREKAYLSNAIRTLINYLIQFGYNQANLTPKALQSPSGKDVKAIFQFLHGLLDPGYVYQKKFEEEVPGILRGVRYV
jgi:hypothetical protein